MNVLKINDLGVLLDSKLLFKSHIEKIINNSNKNNKNHNKSYLNVGGTAISDPACMQLVLLIYEIFNSLKYKADYVYFYIASINLRLQNNNIFLCNNVSNSPINNIEIDCNRFIERHNIDLFACQLGLI